MQSIDLFVEVLVPFSVPGYFTYSVPPDMAKMVSPGKRVVVQFGKKKIYTALIRRIYQGNSPDFEIKNILDVLDDNRIVEEVQFTFWEWISNYYMCTTGEVMKAALPAGLKLESETRVTLHPDLDDISGLTEVEEHMLDYIQNHEKVTIDDLKNLVGPAKAHKALQNLYYRELVLIGEELKATIKPKTEKLVRLLDPFFNTEESLRQLFDKLAKREKQLSLVMTFVSLSRIFSGYPVQLVTKKELLQKSDTSQAVLNTLIKNQIFEIYARPVDRMKFEDASSVQNPLNEAQQKAYEQIVENFSLKQVTLLHGITSSGKTELYIHLIRDCLTQGKQVLYLLPEIALTTQIITRLTRIFGNHLGVYHSRFSDAERVEVWNRVLHTNDENHCPLVLGVRSSIFLPFSNLGLIIVDEEHENSYKQFDPAPRYHARDAAIYLASLHKAKVLLGTATPSLESYQNMISGKYGHVELLQRYLDIQLPVIHTSNIREAKRKKTMKSILTPDLYAHILNALGKKEQVILFQNRRGYSIFLECTGCGWIPQCRNCDVSLTYHRQNNQLVCHYCGYTETTWSRCQKCGSTQMETRGIGTEKIEDEVAILFPEARIARMDLDSTRGKYSYQKLIDEFEKKQIDILIGTQMVTKGLDFDHVSVVGVINADNMLNFPDFRAFERSYQLMAQVSGRAGRKNKQGTVIIQTTTPDHPVIQQVVENNYLDMFTQQASERKKFKYPPFYRLIRITLKHKDYQKVTKASDDLAKYLRKELGDRVLGPEFPPVGRIQEKYLKNILIKIEKDRAIDKIRNIIYSAADRLLTDKSLGSLMVSYDVDPM